MGRIIKRVPLDFDAPLDEVWRGYLRENAPQHIQDQYPSKNCTECKQKFGHLVNWCYEEEFEHCVAHNSKWRDLWYEEPPEGEGYQLWENTTEGSPQSPVFKDPYELAVWCTEYASFWGYTKSPLNEWLFFCTGKDEAYWINKRRNKKLNRIIK